ncbi:Bud-site selection protein [Melanomma pulvis-pyrius CBS 109.77]|uniref:Bud-site selection protein n=1 Tax=Melanomma pulvis-pyrius CBS 109.77 TaxID=1314802 RepID=A0A6A6XLV1_9PLEO|nr:Bud-site selection protein [Melanomma pulvis-pyrius CBS 109.77]
MPKRKRDDALPISSSSPPGPSRTLARQKKLCTTRLETAQKDLLSALRFGAGFERQKYSRRKKTAKGNSDDKGAARVEAEYTVLKGLDFVKVAEQHLRKTIARVKSIKDAEALANFTKGGERAENDAATLNVLARLFNGAGVKKVVDRVVADLKEILGAGGVGLKAGKEVVHKKVKVVDAGEDEEEAAEEAVENESDDDEAFSAFNARIAAPSSAEEDSDDSLSEDHRPPSIDASEVDSEDASDSVPGSEDEDVASEASSSEAINSTALESADSDSEPLPLPKTRVKAPKEPISKSTFLPSLSHAAYYSGSESEASDLDIDLAPRKNRRGQKARQKIWEKKYGDKAKHKEKEDRNKGWDAKKGAVDEKGGRRAKTGRGPELSGENSLPLGGVKKEKKRDDVGVLHPSWLAAKAAKERKVDVKPQGKKIVFD